MHKTPWPMPALLVAFLLQPNITFPAIFILILFIYSLSSSFSLSCQSPRRWPLFSRPSRQNMVLAVYFSYFAFSFTFFLHVLAFNDSAALVDIKNYVSGTGGSTNLLKNWTPAVNFDHCTWYGVTCNKSSNRVISLNFTGAAASGTLSESIGNLSVRSLIIPHNGFSGGIPVSIGKLKFLEVLELQGNNFSGKIPFEISTLGPSLRVLNLSFNSLSDEIPPNLIGLGELRVLDLSNNRLVGGIAVEGIGECSVLTHLKLSNNFLEKGIPRQLGRCKNLRTLLLDGNILQGPIPPEIGQISELRVLDVSTNSLTERIPRELATCRKLSVLVLTNSSNFVGTGDGSNIYDSRLEFNAFDGGIPQEVFMLPGLQILWAPRANLYGRLSSTSNDCCSLKVVNLGQNSFNGAVPEGFGMCKNLTFLDLSSNYLVGYLPVQLQVPCMTYFNVSRNNMSGVLPSFWKGNCHTSVFSYGQGLNLDLQDVQNAYSNIQVWGSQGSSQLESLLDADFVITHDFSWNGFIGLLPSFSVADEFLTNKNKSVYRLFLNNNEFNGSLPQELVLNCSDLLSFSVNMSANQITGGILDLFSSCPVMREFEAAYNQIGSVLDSDIDNLRMIRSFDLRGNRLSTSLPIELGNLESLESFLVGSNNLTGEIPFQLGQLTSLIVLDLSHNALTGSIPPSLANAKYLEILLLNNNELTGNIPSSFSALSSLVVLNASFNNLSGQLPPLPHAIDCNQSFGGNYYLDKCNSLNQQPSGETPENIKHHRQGNRSLIIAVIISFSAVLGISLAVVLVCIYKRRLSRLPSLKERVLVTFADASHELTYDNVVRATGNFSMRNLIGTGGFGSTYKAELVPGYLVAVKRLSIGRIQGMQQFDAEIRTLGRIRHRNLVTLIGYYVGEAEMFLIYNYLSGGNLETFIHNRSDKNVEWSVIYKIALDVAQALAYLHYSCVPRILHRDIKPSNILLDEELNAYLSDFGLARLLEVSQTHATTDVEGTFGYVAPEYATTCRVSDKSDVYSFGVVLLELLSGKKSLDPSFSEFGNGFNIVAWGKLLIKEGRSSEVLAKELWEAGPKEKLLEMLKLASFCTVESLAVRPPMKQVLQKLKQLRS